MHSLFIKNIPAETSVSELQGDPGFKLMSPESGSIKN